MFCKLYKLLNNRSSDIPYSILNNNNQTKFIYPPERKNNQISNSFSELPLPSPFREMQMLKKPKNGKLASLGLISVGMSLAGLVVLVDNESKSESSPREDELQT
ncbi:uncharacterized protein CELE_C34F6.12 [Caenorhabditis elegans]|uniref:Uncharacterized protein n=1 Tax=Caenorhabditis elegans TaxID=6239 RepID=E0AHD2_CAEEL|nr:Uncharacterized protein CELE_C34F6.12 [Caenorhabditis elegans]CBW44365.1 Uncharacterized protein CELE_C34F6.12 [Caenorhabditis elegans]|eukprot:NP_001257138.1 Uncharacterized protein CELE_C34F6.12 [Caenorhabditis elegans]